MSHLFQSIESVFTKLSLGLVLVKVILLPKEKFQVLRLLDGFIKDWRVCGLLMFILEIARIASLPSRIVSSMATVTLFSFGRCRCSRSGRGCGCGRGLQSWHGLSWGLRHLLYRHINIDERVIVIGLFHRRWRVSITVIADTVIMIILETDLFLLATALLFTSLALLRLLLPRFIMVVDYRRVLTWSSKWTGWHRWQVSNRRGIARFLSLMILSIILIGILLLIGMLLL